MINGLPCSGAAASMEDGISGLGDAEMGEVPQNSAIPGVPRRTEPTSEGKKHPGLSWSRDSGKCANVPADGQKAVANPTFNCKNAG